MKQAINALVIALCLGMSVGVSANEYTEADSDARAAALLFFEQGGTTIDQRQQGDYSQNYPAASAVAPGMGQAEFSAKCYTSEAHSAALQLLKAGVSYGEAVAIFAGECGAAIAAKIAGTHLSGAIGADGKKIKADGLSARLYLAATCISVRKAEIYEPVCEAWEDLQARSLAAEKDVDQRPVEQPTEDYPDWTHDRS